VELKMHSASCAQHYTMPMNVRASTDKEEKTSGKWGAGRQE
jgi:hypothetical protein